MPPAPARPFAIVCGQDDFLVGRVGQERYAALTADITDEFSREIIGGFAANLDEVAVAVNRLREAVQTVPMFGGRRVVWLRDVNFLADTPTGRAEGTLELVDELQRLLAAVDPAETSVLVTACPVDRRRAFPKWCEQHADFLLVDGGGDAEALAGVVAAEARAVGARFGEGALDLLLARIGPNSRLLVEEVHKLATHAGEDSAITEAEVAELTPNAAQGVFFDTAECFSAGDLPGTLAALRRHYFAGGDGRPILAALQNRNRLMLQLRALVEAGDVKVGPRGVHGLEKTGGRHAARFGAAAGEKSSFNVFTQNAWYLGKMVGGGGLPSLRQLIDRQREFLGAFAEITARPHEQEEVLRALVVRCLA
jgi:DNA polymerase-3 subunit delta